MKLGRRGLFRSLFAGAALAVAARVVPWEIQADPRYVTLAITGETIHFFNVGDSITVRQRHADPEVYYTLIATNAA